MRIRRLRAGRRTQQVVSWAIGIVVVGGLWLLAATVAHHAGWSLP
jgi:hypothetical protein